MCASGQGSGPSLLPGASAKAIRPLPGSRILSCAPDLAPTLESPRIPMIRSTRTDIVLSTSASAAQRLSSRPAEGRPVARNVSWHRLALQYSNQPWRLEHRNWRDDWLFERNMCPVALLYFLLYNWVRQFELLDLLKLSNADTQLTLIDFPD